MSKSASSSDTDAEYKINDRVIVDWNGCLYEAKIINTKETDTNKKRYKVHFTNWSSSHDEWKDSIFIFPRTEENLSTLKEQRAYIAKHNVKPSKKSNVPKKKQAGSAAGAGSGEKSGSDKNSSKNDEKDADLKSVSSVNSDKSHAKPKAETKSKSLKEHEKNLQKQAKLKLKQEENKLSRANRAARRSILSNESSVASTPTKTPKTTEIKKKESALSRLEWDEKLKSIRKPSLAKTGTNSSMSRRSLRTNSEECSSEVSMQSNLTTSTLVSNVTEVSVVGRRKSTRNQKILPASDSQNFLSTSTSFEDKKPQKPSLPVAELETENSVSEAPVEATNEAVDEPMDQEAEAEPETKLEKESATKQPEPAAAAAPKKSPDEVNNNHVLSLLEELKTAQLKGDIVEEIYWEGETVNVKLDEDDMFQPAEITEIKVEADGKYNYHILLEDSKNREPMVVSVNKLQKISEVRRTKRTKVFETESKSKSGTPSKEKNEKVKESEVVRGVGLIIFAFKIL